MPNCISCKKACVGIAHSTPKGYLCPSCVDSRVKKKIVVGDRSRKPASAKATAGHNS